MRTKPARITPLLCLIAVSVVSCGPDLVTVDEWAASWHDVRGRVDDHLAEPVTQEACEAALVILREEHPGLFPTPLEDLESPVRSWFAVAEGAFFECETDRLAERLRAIEAEVESVLTVEG